MFTTKHPLLKAASVVALLGSVVIASPLYAAPQDGSSPAEPPNSTVELNGNGHVVGSTPDTSSVVPAPGQSTAAHHHKNKKTAEEEMNEHIEKRIKTLHDLLKITTEQDPAWNAVAEAMRENEKAVGDLIHQRRENQKEMTAIDDLESYQKILQAHADGLNRVIPAFESLYKGMSDEQKKNADKVFSDFEGRGHAPEKK